MQQSKELIKLYVEPKVKLQFKTVVTSNGSDMNSVLREKISEYLSENEKAIK